MCASLSFSHSFDAREKHARPTINNVSDTRHRPNSIWKWRQTQKVNGYLHSVTPRFPFDAIWYAADFCFVRFITDADELMIIWLLALIWHLICVCHTVTDETVYVARFHFFLLRKIFRSIFSPTKNGRFRCSIAVAFKRDSNGNGNVNGSV